MLPTCCHAASTKVARRRGTPSTIITRRKASSGMVMAMYSPNTHLAQGFSSGHSRPFGSGSHLKGARLRRGGPAPGDGGGGAGGVRPGPGERVGDAGDVGQRPVAVEPDEGQQVVENLEIDE